MSRILRRAVFAPVFAASLVAALLALSSTVPAAAQGPTSTGAYSATAFSTLHSSYAISGISGIWCEDKVGGEIYVENSQTPPSGVNCADANDVNPWLRLSARLPKDGTAATVHAKPSPGAVEAAAMAHGQSTACIPASMGDLSPNEPSASCGAATGNASSSGGS